MPTLHDIDRRKFFARTAALSLACGARFQRAAYAAFLAAPEPLAGTAPLALDGDLAAHMVDGLHMFLDRAKTKQQADRGAALSDNAFGTQSPEKDQRRLAQIIGALDKRSLPAMEYLSFERIAPLPAALEFGKFNPS